MLKRTGRNLGSSRPRRPRPATFECLERREMLAGDIQHVGHDLIITGTSLDDTAEVYLDAGSPSNPFDNRLVATIKQPGSAVLTKSVLINIVPIGMEVTRIRFMGLNGNDKFTNYTAIATEAYGHSGNDTLTGGGGNDILGGGADNDILKGNGGNDTLQGDLGDDQLLGGAGNDYLRGYNGNDVIAAEDGDDYVVAGEGNDIVGGGFGNDTIYGEGGDDYLGGNGDNDFLDGGIGTDSLHGGSGNDTLKGGVDGKADDLYGGSGADTFHPEWYKDVNVWKNREKNNDYTPSEGDWVAGATNTPLFINFTQLDCLEETDDGPFSSADEPYVVFWVGNLTNPSASYATRTPVFGNTDEGESKYATTAVWGANPAPIAAPTDVVILAIVVENDSSDPNAVVSTVQAAMLPSLLAGIATTATRADLVAKLKTDMQGAVGLGVATGGIDMDEFSSAQELALTSANLVNARNGVAQDFALLFAFDDGHYRVRFSMGRKN